MQKEEIMDNNEETDIYIQEVLRILEERAKRSKTQHPVLPEKFSWRKAGDCLAMLNFYKEAKGDAASIKKFYQMVEGSTNKPRTIKYLQEKKERQGEQKKELPDTMYVAGGVELWVDCFLPVGGGVTPHVFFKESIGFLPVYKNVETLKKHHPDKEILIIKKK
jgi:hypothetical protein